MSRTPLAAALLRLAAGCLIGLASWTAVNAQTAEPTVESAVGAMSAVSAASAEVPAAQTPSGEPAFQSRSSPALPPTPAPAATRRAPAATDAAGKTPATETSQALRVVLGLTVLAILPALLVCLTSFMRIIIVLSMLRHAIGMPETPPNTVLIGLALFLTMFTMSPVLQKINVDAFEPFMAGRTSMEQSYGKGVGPLREFMVRQTRDPARQARGSRSVRRCPGRAG